MKARMTPERELLIAAYAESHEVFTLPQARELIHALQAERELNAKLIEALRPFSNPAQKYGCTEDCDNHRAYWIAARVLKEIEDG